MLAADGAHSKVRETLGVTLEGSSFPEDWPLYDVELDDPLDSESAHVSFVEGGMVTCFASNPASGGCLPTCRSRLHGCRAGPRSAQFTGNHPFISVTALPRRRHSAEWCWRAMPRTFTRPLQHAA